MNQENLSCPCMPQCPNYGKCRQCIAAHAAYYTVPKCIKLMQQQMKEKHLHPCNPHIRKSLPQRVREYYDSHPNTHLRTAAEELNITQWQLLDAMDCALEVPVSDFAEIYARLRQLDSVMLHMDTGAAVMQLTMPLPEAVFHGGAMLLQSRDGNMGLTSLVFPGGLYGLFLVRERLLTGRESLSIALVGEDERIALSVYLRRTAEGTIEESAGVLFAELWSKYQTNKE